MRKVLQATWLGMMLTTWAVADDSWPQFVVDWTGGDRCAADVSFLLHAPAGEKGPVRIVDGHLVEADGRRLRLWGVNATAAATTPAKEAAPVLAGRLAQYGVNCVRFHFLDRRAPDGLIAAGRQDTRALDPDQLERFDYFVAELKKRGIYTNINLNVGRTYQPGDGVKDHELLGFAKALTHFDARLIELQKEYARQLLTHRNPYTGEEYRREPAVVTVELVNENSLVESWFSGRLLGKNTTRNPGTWTDIPASYERDLSEKYNAWLAERLSAQELMELRKEAGAGDGPSIPRLKPDEFNAASQKRFVTEAEFYVGIESNYFADMRRFLKEDIGVVAPLVGTSDHNHGRSGYPLLLSTAQLDIVDGHVYWQHPHYLTGSGGRRAGFTITNSPMVDDPLRSTVVQLSRSAVAGMPYTVSEVGHPFPNEYACEGIPILAAYAAMQDWDAIYWYTWAHRDVAAAGPSSISHFDLFPDPVKMAQLAGGALVFLRSDVSQAKTTIQRSYGRDEVLASLRLGWRESPYFTPGFPLAIPLRHSVRISSLDAAPAGTASEPDSDPILADNGELAWHHAGKGLGIVTVDTSRSQALIGHCAANPRETANLAARMQTPFCAVTLHALDDQAIARAGRLLLTATGRVSNSGMRWNEARNSLESWGQAPTRLEPVAGTILLKGLDQARAITAQPLDGAGRPLGAAIPAVSSSEGWTLPLGNAATPWFVVSVER